MSLCLTPEELWELTHKKKYAAQERALRMMGLDCKRRPDGTVAVDRERYQKWMGRDQSSKPRRWEPNWDDDNVAA